MTKEQIWNEYRKINPCADKYDAWSFGGNTPDMPNILANLVLAKQKTATLVHMPAMNMKTSLFHRLGNTILF